MDFSVFSFAINQSKRHFHWHNMTKSSPPSSPTATGVPVTRKSTRVSNAKGNNGIKVWYWISFFNNRVLYNRFHFVFFQKSNAVIQKQSKNKDSKLKKSIKKGLNASSDPVRIRITEIRDFRKQLVCAWNIPYPNDSDMYS